jgi:hypothetical protein
MLVALLEQALVVWDAVLAVDEAVERVLLASAHHNDKESGCSATGVAIEALND